MEKRFLLFIFFCFVQLIAVKAQTTIVLKPGPDAGKDAIIDSRVGSTNYGSHPDFMALAWTNSGSPTTVRSLIDFDLSAIPDGAIIASAKLSLYSYNSPGNGSHSPLSGSNAAVIQRITSPWNEGSVTWNSQPVATSLHQVSLPASTSSIQNYSPNVTALVQDMVNNRSNSYGFLIKLVTEQYYRRLVFASSDNTNSALRPQLEVTFTVPGTKCITIAPDAALGKDAIIDSRVGSTNYGSHPDFMALAWTNSGAPTTVRSLIDFDLGTIPDGAIINSAKLSLFSYNSPANGSHSPLSGSNAAVIQRITSPWNEGSVTWNTQPAATSLNQVSIAASTASIQHYYPDVTSLVQDMINNRSNSHGFLIKLVTEQYYRRLVFGSTDNANPALRPKLEICYTLPTSACLKLKPDAVAGKDAIIDSRVPSTNYANHPDYLATAWTNGGVPTTVRSLIDFDLSSVPSGATITSAELSLFSYNSPANGTHSTLSGSNQAILQRITSPWNESTVTWSTQPASTTQNQLILPASTTSIQNYTLNVKNLVQDMVNNKSTSFGFLIKLVTEQYYRQMLFSSSDNPDASLHPQLSICYTTASGAKQEIASLVEEIPSKIQKELFVSPNPTQGTVNIISQFSMDELIKVEVYSDRGRLIKSVDAKTDILTSISLGNTVLPGLYLVKIYTAKGKVYNERLVVE